MIKTELIDHSDKAVELIEALVAEVKGAAMVTAVRKAGNEVAKDAKTRITAPGYPGDKPDKRPLSESIIVVVREYEHWTIAYVGGAWPHGAHMHLVEFGHIQLRADGTAVHVPPYPAIRPAIEATQTAQKNAIETELKKAAQ